MTSSMVRVLDLARRYKSLPPVYERERLKEKYGLTYAQIGEALGVTRECAWRWTVGSREPRIEYQQAWVEFWETLMAIERTDNPKRRK